MAGRVEADCGANLMEHSCDLTGARFALVARGLEVCLVPTGEEQVEDPSVHDPAPCHPPTTTITLPWTAPSFQAVKGIIHAPCAKPAMKPETRDALLTRSRKTIASRPDTPAGFLEHDRHRTPGAPANRGTTRARP
jgi:hypothetical protein